MYRLIFHNGQFKGRRFAVQEGTLLIGRDPSCEVALADDDLAAPHHAQLEQRKGGVWLKDLGSLTPTSVNGEMVEEVKLHSGDMIEVGRTKIEFQTIEAMVSTPRRSTSNLHIITLLAVGGILLLEAAFIFIFPIWQRPYLERPKPLAAINKEATNDEALVVANVTSVEVIGDTPFEAAPVAATPPGHEPVPEPEQSPELQAEVLALKQAVSGLHEQVKSLSTSTVAAVATAMEAPVMVTTATVAQAVKVIAPPVTSGVIVAAAPTSLPPAVVTAAVSAVSTAAPATPAVPQIAAPSDPLAGAVRDLLAIAQSEAQKGNLSAADQALERLLLLAPDHADGLVERARVYERRGQLKEAAAIWVRVETLSTNAALTAKARAEQQRLSQAAAAPSVEQKPTPAPAVIKPQHRIRITSLDRQRFQGNNEFDEMRVVSVQMRPRKEEGAIDLNAFEVRIAFYDRVVGTTRVVPTGATVPTTALRVDSYWDAGEQKTVTASYVLPRNFRTQEEARTGQKRTYEGYRVQLWYKGELQDEEALPRNLLKAPMPHLGAAPAPAPATRPSQRALNAPMPR